MPDPDSCPMLGRQLRHQSRCLLLLPQRTRQVPRRWSVLHRSCKVPVREQDFDSVLVGSLRAHSDGVLSGSPTEGDVPQRDPCDVL